MLKKVPVLCLSDFTHGSATSKNKFNKYFGEAIREFGFAIIEDHGINDTLIRDCYSSLKKIFDINLEKRMKYVDPTGWGQRGFVRFGQEKAKNRDLVDLKEFWHVGREYFVDEVNKVNYPKNIWPDLDVPDFKKNMIQLYDELDQLSNALLISLSEYLNLPKFTLSKLAVDGNSILRGLHYPPLTNEQSLSGSIRAAEHEDINLITILCEATEPGLQILTRDGYWLDVESGPHQMVIDSGDMLSRITNNVIPSTTHRVINPPGSAQQTSRYSMPFFVHAYEDCELRVFENCCAPSHPVKYSPITAGEFLRERLRAIGLGGN